MTFKEKLKKEYPDKINNRVKGGCRGCPHDYGYEIYEEKHEYCFFPKNKEPGANCKACWNREIPEEEIEEEEKQTIKDSGERRQFESGAVRDMAEGKGDMMSLPPNALLRLSKLYEQGAKKYTRFNYLKGIPCTSFLDSALRHLFKYMAGWDDEDHLASAVFNVLGIMEMEHINKDMQDIPNRSNKKTFEYGCD